MSEENKTPTEKVTPGALHPMPKPELPEKELSGFQAKAKVVIPGYDKERVDKDKWYDCYNLEKRRQNGNEICFYIKDEHGNFIFCIQNNCAVLGGHLKLDDDNIQRAAWEIRTTPAETAQAAPKQPEQKPEENKDDSDKGGEQQSQPE